MYVESFLAACLDPSSILGVSTEYPYKPSVCKGFYFELIITLVIALIIILLLFSSNLVFLFLLLIIIPKIMALEEIKESISNFKNFYSRLFIPSSKQYFEKTLTETYSKNFISKEDLKNDSKFHIKFNSLIERFPFIEDLIDIRPKVKSFPEFVSLCYLIFDDYFKRLKEINTMYVIDSTSQTSTSFAQNVVNDVRTRFYQNNKEIFFLIEKKYSIELLKSTIKEINIDNDIGQTLKDKSGPKQYSKVIFTALKYAIIHAYDKQKRKEDIKVSFKEFYINIGQKEGLKYDQFKNYYSPFSKESHNLKVFMKESKVNKYVEYLLDDRDIKNYSEVLNILNEINDKKN